MTDVLDALAAAVAAAPDRAPLRVHYGCLLHDAGRHVEAVEQASAALRLAPTDGDALSLLTRATTALQAGAAAPSAPATAPVPAAVPTVAPGTVVPDDPAALAELAEPLEATELAEPLDPFATIEEPVEVVQPIAADGSAEPDESAVDWEALEEEVGIDVPPPFAGPESPDAGAGSGSGSDDRPPSRP